MKVHFSLDCPCITWLNVKCPDIDIQYQSGGRGNRSRLPDVVLRLNGQKNERTSEPGGK